MEFRLAVRGLLRRPAFTFTVCLTLALVIGAAVAIASVIQGMLLRPPPFHERGRLIAIDAVAGGDTGKLATPKCVCSPRRRRR